MPGAEAGKEQTYQWLLRALGAYLDREPRCRITVIEVPEGFRVRSDRAVTSLDPVGMTLRRDWLVEQLHRVFPGTRSTPKTEHPGIWRHVPTGYQNFFRALGHELDTAHARNIVIDELDDEVVLTYSFPDPPTGVWKKRMAILGIRDVEAILDSALARRGTVQTTIKGS